MQNSAMQLRNVLRAFGVVTAGVQGAAATVIPPKPLLLVDDMVDSGWTLTVAAVMLRQRGSGPVYPFALARSSPREG